MKTFDLKTVEIANMSADEQNELMEYVLSLDPVEIYEYLFFMLNEKYPLCDETVETLEVGKFLARKEFKSHRESIMMIVDDEEENKQENFKSKNHYLACNIAYLKQMISDCSDINNPVGYEKEIEDLNKLETEYKTL